MNKGFSLIETILYVSLLSLILVGIFSSILSYMHSKEVTTPFSEEDYQLLISNYHGN